MSGGVMITAGHLLMLPRALLADLSDRRPTTVDLTRLGFVTSVGAGLLLDAVRTAADVTVVLPTGGPARHLLDITGLTGMLRGTGRPASR
jgi:hypothetical protein